jgi:quercetin dioxygenase-like cupin family protein
MAPENTSASHTPDKGDIAALVDYQDGAVVSKVLLKRNAGTVTLFAFAEGEGLSEHTAPFDALVHVLDGEADITLGGTMHRLSAGQYIILPANVPHSLEAARPFKMLLIMIREAQSPRSP